jgi:hypothetical protein
MRGVDLLLLSLPSSLPDTSVDFTEYCRALSIIARGSLDEKIDRTLPPTRKRLSVSFSFSSPSCSSFRAVPCVCVDSVAFSILDLDKNGLVERDEVMLTAQVGCLLSSFL